MTVNLLAGLVVLGWVVYLAIPAPYPRKRRTGRTNQDASAIRLSAGRLNKVKE